MSCGATCPPGAGVAAATLRKRPLPKLAPELTILFRPDVIAHRKQFGLNWPPF